MTCVQTYSPSEVTLSVALLYEIAGYSPESLISINRDEQFYTTQKGSTGGVERTHIADNTYTLEISLAQTSPSNSILNALATIDRFSKSAVFPIFAADKSGNSIFLATSCWIESPPSASYTGSIETRTWSIKCTEMVFGLGGNPSDDSVTNELARLGTLLGQFGNNLGVI